MLPRMAKLFKWDDIPGFDRVKEQYVQLDPEQWLKDHGILDEGRKRGKLNQPAADDDSLDGFESRIVAWMNKRGRGCREEVSGHLSDLESDLADMENDAGLEILKDEVSELQREAEIELEVRGDAGRIGLTGAKSDLRTAAAELERFRRRAGLTRLADDSHRRNARWFILFCFAAEVVMNATLLADVNPYGLLGSIGQMGLISAVNVLILGFPAGGFLRQRNHASALRRVGATGGIASIIALVVAFNLMVGHFRDSLQAVRYDLSADILTMGNDTLDRMLAAPFDLASFQSALLVFVGIAFFGVGAWKWYQRDDPYPGYGKLARQLNDRKAAYVAAYEAAQRMLRQAHEGPVDKLKDKRHQLEIKQSKWRELCKRGEKVVRNYPINASQHQVDLDFLLAAYRTANRDARTAPSPPHFGCTVRLDAAILQPPEFHPPQETSIARVAEKVNCAIKSLLDAYDVKRSEVLTLEAVLEEAVASAHEPV